MQKVYAWLVAGILAFVGLYLMCVELKKKIKKSLMDPKEKNETTGILNGVETVSAVATGVTSAITVGLAVADLTKKANDASVAKNLGVKFP